jgi:parallel beta-helix repeat protein
MDSTTVQANSYIGLKTYSGAEVTATRCTFASNGWGACVVQQGGPHPSATFSLCTFDENDEGLRVQSTSNVVVDTSQFTDQTAEGVYCLGGADIEITRSTFDDNLVGIKCDASSPEITENTIQYSTGGIGSDNSANPLVRRNKIRYNATGLVCLNDGTADLDPCCPSCGGVCPDSCLDEANSILYSTGFHVSNLNGDTLDAECTYWGKKVLPSKFYGLVDYTPYLTQDPLAAPAWQGEETTALPLTYALSQNYPNPFNPVTTIRYSIPPPGGRVSIRIYNVRGELVRTLVDETVSAGSYTIPWEGEDNRGQKVASGVYFVRMVARDFRSTKKLLVLK